MLLATLSIAASAQDATVHGAVNIINPAKSAGANSDAVVWLTPLRNSDPVPPGPKVRLLQNNKRFIPHMLVVTLGTQIDFPNEDPYFHNVFSIYRGKPFDLGLYESGSTRTIHFNQPGVSYIFCNIHPEMSAVIVALRTPHFATTTTDGNFQIAHVPPGRYKLEFWYERASEAELATLSRDVDITTGENKLPGIAIHFADGTKEHLNKYGEPYSRNKKEEY
ncbi:MAG: hypothetical protein JWO13_2990 [Acidobacteriales bacterium]|nr:hypothetical protein [Terriglobales bacterium]